MKSPYPLDFHFPDRWQLLNRRGFGGFITHICHRLPDETLILWSSRRFRKRNSSEVLAAASVPPVRRSRRTSIPSVGMALAAIKLVDWLDF